ncbi:DUF4440 domain-containing protein [Peribacillus butanolivorans]|uniref:nuclear transport factor 2 family protein n=1 Tax=Peribacillus butanolivorans TaxID=421767 RepID=UPI0030C8D72A
MESKSLLKEHLCQLEEALLKPEIRTSPEELSKLLKDDFFEFGSSGNVWYKRDCIGDEGIGVGTMTLSNFEIHQLSEDTVLTTYRIYNEIKMEHTLRSSIWKYRNGRWQMFFHQGTKTKSPL